MKLILTLILFINTCRNIYSQTISAIPRNAIVSHADLVIPVPKVNKIISKDSIASNGYYSWKVTGDTDLDGASIQAASEKFKIEHPDIYAKISSDIPKIIYITLNDFNVMNKQKQQYVLNNRQLFVLDVKIYEFHKIKK